MDVDYLFYSKLNLLQTFINGNLKVKKMVFYVLRTAIYQFPQRNTLKQTLKTTKKLQTSILNIQTSQNNKYKTYLQGEHNMISN